MRVFNDQNTYSSRSEFNLTIPNFSTLPKPQVPGSIINKLPNRPYISNGTEWTPFSISGVNGGVIWAPFRTGDLPCATYTSFIDAYNAITELCKPNVFYFDPTEGPVVFPVNFPPIPVGTYDFTGIEWVGLQKGSNMNGATSLLINIPDGVHFIGLQTISSLQINYTGLTPCITIPILSNQLQIIYLQTGCTITTTSAPFYRIINSDNLGNCILSFVLDFFSVFNGTQPVVSVGDGVFFTLLLASSSGLNINTIATDFPPVHGNAILIQYLGSYNPNSTPLFPFIKTAWTNINAATSVSILDESGSPKSFTTNVAPLVTNDFTQGWKNTDIWINSTTSTPYICIDASVGLWHAF